MGVTWLAADSNSLPCTIDRIYLSTLYMVGFFSSSFSSWQYGGFSSDCNSCLHRTLLHCNCTVNRQSDILYWYIVKWFIVAKCVYLNFEGHFKCVSQHYLYEWFDKVRLIVLFDKVESWEGPNQVGSSSTWHAGMCNSKIGCTILSWTSFFGGSQRAVF
jgi:hypothetical protein